MSTPDAGRQRLSPVEGKSSTQLLPVTFEAGKSAATGLPRRGSPDTKSGCGIKVYQAAMGRLQSG